VVLRKVAVQLLTVRAGRHVWADLLVNGRRVGRSPLTLKLRPGRYRIAARRSGVGKTERRVVVRAGKPRSVVLSLQ